MKKINLSIILVIVFFLLAPGCASKLPLVDSCRSNNGAISLEEFKKNIQEEEIQKKTHVKTFSESETNSSLDKKSVIPKKRKNNNKTLKTFEKYEKLEKRVANLETQTQTNTEILNKHSG